MGSTRRVAVTGLGVVSPCGIGKTEFWNNILAARTFVGPVQSFDASSLPTRIGGEVRDFDPRQFMSGNDVRRFDECAQYALAACHLALKDSGLDLKKCDKSSIGVTIGSCHGAIRSIERDILSFQSSGLHGVSPFAMANASSNISAGLIAIQNGFKGPNFSVVSACGSGTQSVGEACRKVASGEATIMVAGGTEAAITAFTYAGYSFISAMSRRNHEPHKACRPFDRDRDGFVMSEGAGMLVLEEMNHALQRDAKIYAEIVGYGAACDAAHVTNLSSKGAGVRKAMQAAIEDAGISPEDIDYINTHGSSTPLADRCEAAAIKDLFKDHARDLLVNSTKSITGHMMGASGAVEAVVCALSLDEQVVHPTLNYEFPDDECGLEGVTTDCISRDMGYAMSNSIGFGGPVASVVMKKYEARG